MDKKDIVVFFPNLNILRDMAKKRAGSFSAKTHSTVNRSEYLQIFRIKNQRK